MGVSEISRIGVIGAGGWGTTLANLLAEKGCRVDLWVREEEVFRQIKEERVNRTFLPDRELVPELKPVMSFEEALLEKELLLVVVPSHVFRDVLTQLKPHLCPGVGIVTGTKGMEKDTLMTMSQVAESLLPKEYAQGLACLAGPSFAREVSQKHPTAVTIACRDLEYAERLQRLFSTEFFRVYITEDLMGVELSGALKNVIAIAAGVADGLHIGHNARAALITRGLAEIARLGVAMGANPLTFAGLAGLGDLVLTCTGDLSRNRNVGLRIAEGKRLEDIVGGMAMVAEGVKTAISAYQLGKKMGVEMPIINQVYEVLYKGKDPREATRDLMTRDLKVELEH
ncbi:MAG: NAD(P)H-dependent glycerol-3-phosphate dehydrogenase [Desulfobacteraceae bacterium]|jgi:glycerol-3-phosphate dehydrogenase (NAD(P)+)